MNIGDGDLFLTKFSDLIKDNEKQALKPGTMDLEEQHLAAVCQRLVLHFGAEVAVKQHAEMRFNDDYDGSAGMEKGAMKLKDF